MSTCALDFFFVVLEGAYLSLKFFNGLEGVYLSPENFYFDWKVLI